MSHSDDGIDAVRGSIRLNLKTYILIGAVNFAYGANLLAVVSSGLLSNSLGTFFHSAENSVWFAIALNIFTAAFGPPASQVADLWGRKWPVIVTQVFGMVGAIVTSRAQNINTVIAGYCLIGVATSAQPLLHAVVSEVVPRAKRPIAQGCLNASAGVAAFVGVCMGGALLRHDQYENYRIYMYVLAACYFVAAAGVLLLYNPPARELEATMPAGEKLRSMDWIGYCLLTPGLVLFSLGLGWTKNPYTWTDAHILAPFLVGVACLIAFAVYEWRFTTEGLLHHGLFRKGRNFPLVLGIIFAEGGSFFVTNQYFSYQLGVLRSDDLLMGGLPYGVMFLMSAVFAIAGGWYATKRKSVKSVAVSGMIIMTIYFVCMAAVTRPGTPGSAYWVLAVVLGIGLGFILPTAMVIAQLSTPRELIAEASALVLATRSTGATVVLAICQAVFSSSQAKEIPSRVAAATLPLGLPPTSIGPLLGALQTRDPKEIFAVPGVSPRIVGAAGAAVLDAFAVTFRWMWVVGGVFIIVGAIMTLSLVNPREQFTAHIDAPADEEIAIAQARVEGRLHEKMDVAEHLEHVEGKQ